MSDLTEREVLDELAKIESGETPVVPVEPPCIHYCGDLEYRSSDGWRFVVFNDVFSWDYLDAVTAPDGRQASSELMEQLLFYRPNDSARWGFHDDNLPECGSAGRCVFWKK